MVAGEWLARWFHSMQPNPRNKQTPHDRLRKMWAERKRLVMDAVGNIADGSGKKVKDLVDAVRGCDVLCVVCFLVAG